VRSPLRKREPTAWPRAAVRVASSDFRLLCVVVVVMGACAGVGAAAVEDPSVIHKNKDVRYVFRVENTSDGRKLELSADTDELRHLWVTTIQVKCPPPPRWFPPNPPPCFPPRPAVHSPAHLHGLVHRASYIAPGCAASLPHPAQSPSAAPPHPPPQGQGPDLWPHRAVRLRVPRARAWAAWPRVAVGPYPREVSILPHAHCSRGFT
jgi:hypothetical protein